MIKSELQIDEEIEITHLKVEGHADLERETASHGIINTNYAAYHKAVKRAHEAQNSRDEIRNATREINSIKSELHSIKSMLLELTKR
jgi:hypothetical protein